MKSFITYTHYNPFVMGGKVNQRVKIEVDVVDLMSYKGIDFFIAVNKMIYTLHEFSTGQMLGYPYLDFESCKKGALKILEENNIEDLKKEMKQLPLVENVHKTGDLNKWLIPIKNDLFSNNHPINNK